MSGVANENSRNLPSTRTGSSTHSADADILDFRVIEDAVLGSFAPHARFLDAAEWRNLRGDDTGIESDYSVFNCFGHPPAARKIASVYIGCQAKLGVVGHGDGLRLAVEFEQRRHRAECFLARHQHFGGDIGQDRWLKKKSPQRVA